MRTYIYWQMFSECYNIKNFHVDILKGQWQEIFYPFLVKSSTWSPQEHAITVLLNVSLRHYSFKFFKQRVREREIPPGREKKSTEWWRKYIYQIMDKKSTKWCKITFSKSLYLNLIFFNFSCTVQCTMYNTHGIGTVYVHTYVGSHGVVFHSMWSLHLGSAIVRRIKNSPD